MTDPHNRKNKLTNAIKRLENSNYAESDKELLLDFRDHLFAENISISRVDRYITTFLNFEPHIDFKLDEADKKDIISLVGKINQDVVGQKEQVSPWTKAEWKKGLKKFYKWHTQKENPEIVDFFSSQPKRKNIKMTDPDDLPDEDIVLQIRREMQNDRDRAFIRSLYESGTRISELLNLKWGNIRSKDSYAVLKVDGKTGERRIPVKDCLDDLMKWKKEHPNSEEDSYVFTKLEKDEQISYAGIRQQKVRAVEDFDEEPDCKTNFHAFRKARATFLARKNMGIFQLMQFFGWRDPDTAKTYVRLANSDLEETFKEMHGIEEGSRNSGNQTSQRRIEGSNKTAAALQ